MGRTRAIPHQGPVCAAEIFDHQLRVDVVDVQNRMVARHRRIVDPTWIEDVCAENNNYVFLGKESYFVTADGFLMPVKKGQKPPDLRYFEQTQK